MPYAVSGSQAFVRHTSTLLQKAAFTILLVSLAKRPPSRSLKTALGKTAQKKLAPAVCSAGTNRGIRLERWGNCPKNPSEIRCACRASLAVCGVIRPPSSACLNSAIPYNRKYDWAAEPCQVERVALAIRDRKEEAPADPRTMPLRNLASPVQPPAA